MQAGSGADTDGVSFPATIDRIASLENRLATMEAQQNWLRLERCARGGGYAADDGLVDQYVAARDGAAIVRGEQWITGL